MRYTAAYSRFFYTPLRVAANGFLRLRYGYRHDFQKLPEGGVLIAANHTAGVDPVLCAVCFEQVLCFVLSEHLKRKKLVSKLLDLCFDNIIRVKTRTESQTAFTMIKRLREGKRVLIFPEGNMTYSGANGRNMPGLGRLAKMSGCSLVTLRLENTFAVSPRWSKKSGRGDSYGRIVHVYSPEELKQMNAAQIEDAMTQDLFFDFYAQPCGAYQNARRAECLQSALFVCPRCGKVSTLHARRDRFWCDCGLSLRLDERLRFQGEAGAQPPFETIAQWYEWQQTQLSSICDAAREKDAPVTQDASVQVNEYTVSPPTTTPIACTQVRLYPDRLEVGDGEKITVALDQITDVTTLQRRILCICVAHEKYYEFIGTDDFSPVKYAFLIRELTGARSMI